MEPATIPQAEFVDRSNCIACDGSPLLELSRGRFTEEPLHGFMKSDPWGTSPLPHLQNAEWIYVRCSKCGMAYHRRVLNEAWNDRRFSEWASADAMHEFERRLGRPSERKFERTRSQVGHVLRIEKLTRPLRGAGDPVRLLDFGCGFGDFVLQCRQFGFDAVGIDRAKARIEEARVPILASLDDLPDNRPFHAVTLFEVLEHLNHPAEILKALAPRVVPGGLLILETPDATGITGIRTRHEYDTIDPLDHINGFTPETLQSIAGRFGFRLRGRGPVHVTTEVFRVIKTLARHALGRDGRTTQFYFTKDGA